MLASDSIPAGGLFNWKLDTRNGRAYSLKAVDYPRVRTKTSSFHQVGQCSVGRASTTAFLNPVFCWSNQVAFEQARASIWKGPGRLLNRAESVKISYKKLYTKHMISHAHDIAHDIIQLWHPIGHHAQMTSCMTSSYISYEMSLSVCHGMTSQQYPIMILYHFPDIWYQRGWILNHTWYHIYLCDIMYDFKLY